MPKLGDKIKNKRIELNMSQYVLAQLTGYKTRSSIAQIEAGKTEVPEKRIPAFATALGVPVDFFYDNRLDDIVVTNTEHNNSSFKNARNISRVISTQIAEDSTTKEDPHFDELYERMLVLLKNPEAYEILVRLSENPKICKMVDYLFELPEEELNAYSVLLEAKSNAKHETSEVLGRLNSYMNQIARFRRRNYISVTPQADEQGNSVSEPPATDKQRSTDYVIDNDCGNLYVAEAMTMYTSAPTDKDK